MADRPTDQTLREVADTAEEWFELVEPEDDTAYLRGITDALTWALGDADQPVLPEPKWCLACDGRGGWSSSIEAANGRVLDLDSECRSCEGRRVQ